MKGGFLLSLMCLIAGAHAYGYGGQTSCQDTWGSCSLVMTHYGGCNSPQYGGYMKQACHGSCPQFCPKPCEWGSWTEGSCDRTCGGGVRKDTRRKLIQEQNGGYCPGGDYRIESCNTQQCPVCACKDAINPRGRHWGNCLKNYHGGKICYVQDEANSGCKDKRRSGSFKPNYYSWDACK